MGKRRGRGRGREVLVSHMLSLGRLKRGELVYLLFLFLIFLFFLVCLFDLIALWILISGLHEYFLRHFRQSMWHRPVWLDMAVMYILQLLMQCPADTDTNPNISAYPQDIWRKHNTNTDGLTCSSRFRPFIPALLPPKRHNRSLPATVRFKKRIPSEQIRRPPIADQ